MVQGGTTDITLTEALTVAIPVDVFDNTIVDADAYYHGATDTLIVVQDQTVQTVLNRNDAPLRCPHDHPPEDCPECSHPHRSLNTDPFENPTEPPRPPPSTRSHAFDFLPALEGRGFLHWDVRPGLLPRQQDSPRGYPGVRAPHQ